MSETDFYAAGRYLQNQMARLGPENLGRQSGCEHWDEQQLVNHVAQVATAIGDTAGGQRFSVSEHAETIASTPAEASAAVQRALELLDSGPLRAMSSIEFTAHAWDIGIGLDPDHRIPGELAESILVLARKMLTDDSRGSHFAPRQQARHGANASEQLIAFLGRLPKTTAANP
ncbi:maleylpyruvate isomerase family mycothiol-dependent enzyme [Glutamicibacter protophormiae]|uniref:maleylpyruvate isomerase family mycothiol-dependent enzyme n=1 Tax=Glutamicibacter protophormiae TaxID=37930 RepID=UPI00195D9024|nr:maleylpyruvate isomerase family mycothiol-dependent enzyme [Glutamicibacter protophormiae]QRQ78223.1 maleylpyruvate isomerase family mycothiol-dependent enzyme [Glutamicibacter protophormiae]